MAWLERWRREAAGWAGRGLDLLCPPRCACCSVEPPAAARADDLPAGVFVCPACTRALADERPRCPGCGGSGSASDCGHCRRARPAGAGLVVLGGYGDALREAVLKAKRPGAEAVAAALGRLLAVRHRETLAGWRCDAVVPVPMHWARRMFRGTSAAEEIARQLAADLRLPCRRWLRRTRPTRMQNELPFEERRGNVRGAFRGRRGPAGRRVLLVDDVVTSGGTLSACTAALMAAGAAAVYAAAAARAERSADARDEDA